MNELFYFFIPVGILFLILCYYFIKKQLKTHKKKAQPQKQEKPVEEPKSEGVKYSNNNYLKISIPEEIKPKETAQQVEDSIVEVDENTFIIRDEEKEFYGEDVDDFDENDLEGSFQEQEELVILKNTEIKPTPVKQNSIAQQFSSLSPEMKAIMFTNVLDKKHK